MRGPWAGGVLLLLGMTRAAAWGHDFWVDPSSYRPRPGAEVTVTLRLGHGESTARVARSEDDIEQFVLVGGDRVVAIGGAPGDDPAGRVMLPAPGCWWVAYRSGRSFSALAPAPFEAYLRRRGLEHVAAARRLRGERDRYGTELYSRNAKALLIGPGCDGSPAARAQIAQPLGLTLELVPESNPARLLPGDRLSVRVLFQGRPQPEVLVEASAEGDGGRAVRHRSDAEGRIRIRPDAEGRWVLTAVFMARAGGPERADWESWWASLSFELRGARWRERRFDRRRFLPGVPIPARPLAPSR